MSRTESAGPLPPSVAAALWPAGAASDARALLDRNPELRRDKDAALDLAYEEYCRLVEAGEAPDPEAFCAGFPTFQASLLKVIQAAEYLAANPGLLEERGPISWPVAGETFLGFRLLRELGRGAFARVFLAAEPDLGDRLVAVKLSPHGGTEAQTLGPLDHPNVVKVYAVRRDERSGLTAVCMPYLGAATLDNVLSTFAAGRPDSARTILDAARGTSDTAAPLGERPAPHPLLEKVTYAEGVCLLGAQLAEALDFLHRHSIYHRDLKPSNVLLCPDGRPMLLDFNLSADPRAGRERLGGTLPYMSPEQVLATFDPARAADPVDGRSDLFSLGVILFELLTGRHPFGALPPGVPSAEDGAALLARQKEGAPALRPLCPQVTPGLARVATGCLAFDRARRPRDAAEVAALLRRDLAPHHRLLRRLLGHPGKLAAAAVLAVSLATGAVAYQVTRPTECERLMQEARQASAAGDLKRALDRADRAVAAEPGSPEAHFVRARVALGANNVLAARDDFREARRLRAANDLAPDLRLTACVAYCLSQVGDHPGAVKESREAIEAGFATAEVYNNLAYSQMPSDLLGARASLTKALDLAPGLPAAHLNRLVLLKQELLRHPDRAPLPEVRPALGAAFGACPESAELYGHAADVCAAAGRAAAGRLEGGWDDDTLTYLEKGTRLGLDLGSRPTSPLYAHLLAQPRFGELKPNPGPDLPTARLIDPLAGGPPAR
jgi:serine/threonine protein kinase/Flp pilus assembly protein TadD